jgi:hypothetical protein
MKSIIYIIVLLISLFNFSYAQLSVTTIKNEEINLNSLKTPEFIIFYQSPSCHQCFINLSKALKLIDSNIIITTVIKCQNDIVQKKEIQVEVNNYYHSNDIFYDNIENGQNNKSLFHYYKITNTPALLYLDNGIIKYISYNEIFDGEKNILDIKNRIQDIIFKINK